MQMTCINFYGLGRFGTDFDQPYQVISVEATEGMDAFGFAVDITA